MNQLTTEQILEQARQEIAQKDLRIAELEKRLESITDLYSKFEEIAQYLFDKLESGGELEATLYNEADGYEWTISDPDTGQTASDYYWFNAVEVLMNAEKESDSE